MQLGGLAAPSGGEGTKLQSLTSSVPEYILTKLLKPISHKEQIKDKWKKGDQAA